MPFLVPDQYSIQIIPILYLHRNLLPYNRNGGQYRAPSTPSAMAVKLHHRRLTAQLGGQLPAVTIESLLATARPGSSVWPRRAAPPSIPGSTAPTADRRTNGTLNEALTDQNQPALSFSEPRKRHFLKMLSRSQATWQRQMKPIARNLMVQRHRQRSGWCLRLIIIRNPRLQITKLIIIDYGIH